eukprot:10520871-Alexandrium_andersonii.AAC.1
MPCCPSAVVQVAKPEEGTSATAAASPVLVMVLSCCWCCPVLGVWRGRGATAAASPIVAVAMAVLRGGAGGS